MKNVISKTYRLDISVVNFLTEQSKQWEISQSATLKKVIEEYKKYVRNKQYHEDIIKASQDKAFLEEQMELAEAGWIADGL